MSVLWSGRWSLVGGHHIKVIPITPPRNIRPFLSSHVTSLYYLTSSDQQSRHTSHARHRTHLQRIRNYFKRNNSVFRRLLGQTEAEDKQTTWRGFNVD